MEGVFNWLGWEDLNPRMTGPKPVALPLGDTPALKSFYKIFTINALYKILN